MVKQRFELEYPFLDRLYVLDHHDSNAGFPGNERYRIHKQGGKEMVDYLDKIQTANGLFYHVPDVPIYLGRGECGGKGAYPNYISKVVIDGFEEHRALLEQGKPASIQEIYNIDKISGMWIWTCGGDREGP